MFAIIIYYYINTIKVRQWCGIMRFNAFVYNNMILYEIGMYSI